MFANRCNVYFCVISLIIIVHTRDYDNCNAEDISNCQKYSPSSTIQKSILFIGNSYIYHNRLDHMLQNFGAAATQPQLIMNYECIHSPGASLVRNSRLHETHELLRDRNWDVVILQDQSLIPTGIFHSDFVKTLGTLRTFYAPRIQGSVILYQTWGRQDGFRGLGSFREMNQRVASGYVQYANEFKHVKTARVGDAFSLVYEENHFLWEKLYDNDSSHPSLEGTYLAVACFYVTLTGGDVKSVNYIPEGISRYNASILRDFAKRACTEENNK